MEKLLLALATYKSFSPQERCQYLKVKGYTEQLGLEWNNRISLRKSSINQFENYYKTFSEKLIHLQMSKNQIHYISILNDNYPKVLKQIYSPPLVLFYMGDLNILKQHCLGIVGSRRATAYGFKACEEIIPSLVKDQLTIVSGLAKGIDTKAHAETIRAGGKTIAVIGTGIDRCYPKENKQIQEKIAQEHLLVSEYPPGVGPQKHHFPYRNRIIAGLSRGVLVIESQQRSGSLITARQALEEGRDVFAVPGSIFNSYSAGCNDLIKQGAIPVHHPSDILNEWENF